MGMGVSSLPPEVWEATPPEQARIVALQAEVRELRDRLGQDSSYTSRSPSPDSPQASANVKRQPAPSARKRGGRPGHHGSFLRSLLPVEQVDQVVVVVAEVCRQCQQPSADADDRRRARVWRHQLVELLPLAVRVTE
jgi:transposase